MQRAFSFQGRDVDNLSYHPVPVPTAERRPLRDDGAHTHPLYDTTAHRRHDSVSTISSVDSSHSSFARGGLGAPSPRSFQSAREQDMYSRQQQPPARPRKPVAVAGGNIDYNPHYNPDSQRYYDPAPPRHSPTASTLHSSSPMSQSAQPLIPGTPGSRFADPMPSPPTPRGGVLPTPPPHRSSASDSRVLNDPVGGRYTDNPYSRYSTTWDPQLSAQVVVAGDVEGMVFSDDEDETMRGRHGGGVMGGMSGRTGRGVAGTPPRSAGAGVVGLGVQGPGQGPVVERGGLLGGSEGGSTQVLNEKNMPSDWLQKQTHSKKKTRWIVAVILIILICAAAGGATAGVLLSKKKGGNGASSAASAGSGSGSGSGGGGGGLTESEDITLNGDLNKDSAEIKELMANDKLHKVFHGIDYTPLNSQYPECIHNPPTQNNITRDVAAMSLLTDRLRLYGTDCNQTEMVLHAITALDIPMKIWLGVWLDSNTTTNTRQLTHLYTLLTTYSSTRFEGIAVGNEVLFREDLSEQQLFSTIQDVRDNLTSLNIDLPVGTSDLGDNWRSTMVGYVDVLMANVHPFFGGLKVEDAAAWTSEFFNNRDVSLIEGLAVKPRVMISEVGWPSAGGSLNASVAGIPEMNRFMEDFVCTENKKGTEYFWFSAFDEPWKVKFNEPEAGKEWEDKWGLMDVNRNLKDGLVIPTCT